MAVYFPTVTNPNTIGGLDSQTTVQSPTINFSQFTDQAAKEHAVLQSVEIVSLSNDLVQLTQPINFTTIDSIGNKTVEARTPVVDSYAFQSQVQNISADFKFDGTSQLQYDILPGSSIKLTLNYKKDDLMTDWIRYAFDLGYWEDDIRNEVGIKIERKKRKKAKELKEPEEIRIYPNQIPAFFTPIKELKEPGETEKIQKAFSGINELSEPEELKFNLSGQIKKPIVIDLKKKNFNNLSNNNLMNNLKNIAIVATISGLMFYMVTKSKPYFFK